MRSIRYTIYSLYDLYDLYYIVVLYDLGHDLFEVRNFRPGMIFLPCKADQEVIYGV